MQSERFSAGAIEAVNTAWAEANSQSAIVPVFPLEAIEAILEAIKPAAGKKGAAVIAGFYYRDNNGDGRYSPGKEFSAALLGAPNLGGTNLKAQTCWNCFWFEGVEPDREYTLVYDVDGIRKSSETVNVGSGINLIHIPIVPEKPLIYVVPHSHFDPEWDKTYEAYMADELPHMLERLEVLREDQNHGFALDEESALRPLLERYPVIVNEVRQRITEGTAEAKTLVASGDLTMVLGESIIRQITVGERIISELLGTPISSEVFWNIDCYGLCFQLPQILAKAGRKYFLMGEYRWWPREAWPGPGKKKPDWFLKGETEKPNPHFKEDMPFSEPKVWDHPEFFMQGLDGSKVLVHRSIYGSSPTTRVIPGTNRPSYLSYFNYYGGDFAPPDRKLTSEIKKLNSGAGDHKCIIATSPQFFKAIENAPDIPTFTTESWMGTWTGSYESRVKARQLSRKIECALLAMESFASMARIHGIEAPHRELMESWYLLLINHHHDPQMTPMMPGLIDEVIDRYREIERGLYRLFPGGLVDRIPGNERRGVAFAVFNPLPWPVTRAVEGAGGKKVVDHKGRPALSQPAGRDAFERRKALFLAENIPALGWRTYYLSGGKSAEVGKNKAACAAGTTMENEHLKVEFVDGLIQSVALKRSGRVVLQEHTAGSGAGTAPGGARINEIFVWKDEGCICIVRPLDFPNEAAVVARSSEVPRTFKFTETGPVRVVAETTFKLAGSKFIQRTILEAGARALRLETDVDWRPAKKEGRRIRTAFPFASRSAAVLRDTPFAVVDGEQGHTIRPVNSWLGLSSVDKTFGAALIHQGTCSIQAEDDVLWMTLFRSVRVTKDNCTSMWDKEGDNSLEQGRNSYTYWLHPFEGDWETAEVSRSAFELNMPVPSFEINRRFANKLPAETCEILLEPGLLVMSAIKPADNDARSLVVRAFNPGSKLIPGCLSTGFEVDKAVAIDILENESLNLAIENGMIPLMFEPYEIKTIKIYLK